MPRTARTAGIPRLPTPATPDEWRAVAALIAHYGHEPSTARKRLVGRDVRLAGRTPREVLREPAGLDAVLAAFAAEAAQLGLADSGPGDRSLAPVALPPATHPPRPRPVFGALRGGGALPDTFFEPLPEAELRAWEGEPTDGGASASDAPPSPAGSEGAADWDAALVTAALRHLRHLDDPERHLMRDTPAVPRHKAAWVRQVLGALRAAGAEVVRPAVYPAMLHTAAPAPARDVPLAGAPGGASTSRAMQDAIGRLQALPDDAQEEVAPRLHDYLTRLEELRTLIQEGIDSGPDEPLDIEAIKRDARAHAGPHADPPPERR